MKTITLFLILPFLIISVKAQEPGDFFSDYGSAGLFIEDWPDTNSYSASISVTSDGHILIPGYYKDEVLGNSRIFLSMYDNLGQICDFGNSCRGFEYTFAAEQMASSVHVLPDGKILVAGSYGYAANYFPFVMRLQPGGALDMDFGNNGIFKDESIQIQVMDMQVFNQGNNYKIILAGSDALHNMKMVMVNADGELETSFGSSGVANISGIEGNLQSICIDNDGEDVYGCGYLAPGQGSVLLKYNLPEGVPDPSFGTEGIISYSSTEGFNGKINAVVYNKENNTLAAFGYYTHADGDFDIFAWRINASNGSPDATFGVEGWAALRSPESDDRIYCAILQSDGKYYFGGSSDFFETSDLLLGRITSNGLPDTDFGTNGLVMFVAPEDQLIFGMTLNPTQTLLYTIGITANEMAGGAIMSAAFHTDYEVAVNVAGEPDNHISLFPNPTRGIIRLTSDLDGLHQVDIYDVTGNLLIHKEFEGKRYDINLETLPASMYFIKVLIPGKEQITYKVIKE